MKEQVETWKIVSSGIAVGLGLTAVSVAVLFQLPIGQDLIRAIRQGTQTEVNTPVPEGHYYAPSPGQAAHKPAVETTPTLLNGLPLPDTVVTIEPLSVLMGRSRIPITQGETFTVVGVKDTFFLCDYLGDTIEIPIISTAWSKQNP